MQVKVRFDKYTLTLDVPKDGRIASIKSHRPGGKVRNISSKEEMGMLKKQLFKKLEYTLDGRTFDKENWTELTLFHALIMSPDVRLLQFAGEPKTPKLPDGAIP